MGFTARLSRFAFIGGQIHSQILARFLQADTSLSHQTKLNQQSIMKILFSSRQNASVLPVLATLLTILIFNPAVGKAQGLYTTAGTGRAADTGGSDMANIVGQLEYNALLALLGALVLMGMVFICHVWKACADLNRPEKNARNLLILVAGLSVFCSSCTVEQRMRAAEYRAAEAAENRACPSPHRHVNYENTPLNNRYPYNGYSNWQSPVFCKYCGQRVFNVRN